MTDAPDQAPTREKTDTTERSQSDGMLRAAVIGNLLLAVPGVAGVVGLVPFALLILSSPGDRTYLLSVFAFLAVAAVGFYLLVGYRRELSHRGPLPDWFWWLSAGYNGIGAALAAAGMTGHMVNLNLFFGLSSPVYPAVALVWTGFMTAFSVSSARRRGVSTGGGAADQ